MENTFISRIEINPQVLTGKPIVRGLRISVDQVLKSLAAGIKTEELLSEYPDLEIEDIKACLLYAAQLVEGERVYPIRVS